MGLRDVLIFSFVFGSLPFILARPYIGVLMWSWLAYMNPHRLTWSLAFDFRFSVVVGGVLVLAVIFSRERKRIIWTPVTFAWLAFFCWTGVTTLFAFFPEDAGHEWSRWWKINLASLITLLVMQSRERIKMLVWVITLSIAFYGVKGGLFAILTGGQRMVFGPIGTFFGDNTSLGLALVMIIPLLRYLQLEAQKTWMRMALAGSMLLTVVATLATQSRGALVGLVGIAAFFVVKSPKRLGLSLAMLVAVPALFAFMPTSWHERMGTIATYDQDQSAMGRINAWWFAINLIKDRPVVGGGFNTFTPELFKRYAPNPDDFHDAHSIYFEVLAEQGIVGLVLFLALACLVIRHSGWIVKACRGRPDLAWAGNLAAMLQVSFVGYALSGAFLGLAYFDLAYHLMVIVVVTRQLVEDSLRQEALAVVGEPGPAPQRPLVISSGGPL